MPAVDVDGLVSDIGEHSVGAAKGDDGGAGEEQTLMDEDAVTGNRDGGRDRREPEYEAKGKNLEAAAGRGDVVVERVVTDQWLGFVGRAFVVVGPGQGGDEGAQQPAEDAGGDDHDRERDLEPGQSKERGDRHRNEHGMVQCAFADSLDGLDDDGDDRWGQAGEQADDESGGASADVQR